MKNIEHIKTVLNLELQHWFLIQEREVNQDFYLYYTPATLSSNAGLIILRDKPANADYQLAMAEPIDKRAGIDANFERIMPIVKELPLIDISQHS